MRCPAPAWQSSARFACAVAASSESDWSCAGSDGAGSTGGEGSRRGTSRMRGAARVKTCVQFARQPATPTLAAGFGRRAEGISGSPGATGAAVPPAASACWPCAPDFAARCGKTARVVIQCARMLQMLFRPPYRARRCGRSRSRTSAVPLGMMQKRISFIGIVTSNAANAGDSSAHDALARALPLNLKGWHRPPAA